MMIDYSKHVHTAIYLGLRPDTSKFSLELNNFLFSSGKILYMELQGQQEDPDFDNFFYVPQAKITVSHRVQQPRRSF